MKQIVKSIVVIAGLAVASIVKAVPVPYYDVTAFLGAEYYYVLMKPKSNWDQIFPKTYQGGTFYIGTQFHNNFAVELGYDWSARQKKDWTLVASQPFFSSTMNAKISGTTHITRSGGHFDIIGILPVVECTDLLTFAGVGWVQPKVQIVNMSVAPNGAMPNTSAIASTSGKGRGVFRLGLGARYMITDVIGLRGKIGWESTSTLAVAGNAYFPQLGYTTKAFKGTTAFSLGAFISF